MSTYTIAVPLFGYIIFFGSIKNGTYIFDIYQFSDANVTTSNLSSFINLKMTYVGLSIIGITTIVFRIVCPEEISVYRDKNNFVGNSINTTYADAYERTLYEVRKLRWFDFAVPGKEHLNSVEIHNKREPRSPISESKHIANLSRTDWIEKNFDGINEVYSVKFYTSDYSLIGIRYLLFLSYTTGFLVSLFPSLNILLPVANEVITYLRMELL